MNINDKLKWLNNIMYNTTMSSWQQLVFFNVKFLIFYLITVVSILFLFYIYESK